MKTLAFLAFGCLSLVPLLANGQITMSATTAAPTDSATATSGPRPISPALRSAMQQESAGNIQAAIGHYQAAIRHNPADRRAYLSYARMLHRLGDINGSVSMYHAWLRQAPQDVVALNDLGLCFLRGGQIHEAVECLQTAVMNHPNSIRYRNNLAIALIQAGRRDEALVMMERVWGPKRAHETLACIFDMRNEAELAAKHRKVAATYDPSRNTVGALENPTVTLTTDTRSTSDTADAELLGAVAPEPNAGTYDAAPALKMAPPAETRITAAEWNFIRIRQAQSSE